jgi:hypothetical protein
MNKTEVKKLVGQDVAVVAHRGKYDRWKGVRATVVEVDAVREVKRPIRYGGRASGQYTTVKETGTLVRWAEPIKRHNSDAPPIAESLVENARIVGPWDEYAEALRQHREHEEAGRKAQKEREEDVGAMVEQLAAAGINAYGRTWRTETVEIYRTQFDRLREILAAIPSAIETIEGLADQQAMADDWYVDRLDALKKLAAKKEN